MSIIRVFAQIENCRLLWPRLVARTFRQGLARYRLLPGHA